MCAVARVQCRRPLFDMASPRPLARPGDVFLPQTPATTAKDGALTSSAQTEIGEAEAEAGIEEMSRRFHDEGRGLYLPLTKERSM